MLERIYGPDRAETSSKLADYEIAHCFSNTAVNVASGYTFGSGADVLGGVALSGKENRPTLITYSATRRAGVLAFITIHADTLTSGHIFGRTGAVPQSVEDDAMTVAAR